MSAEVLLADSAGFCMGVARAVELVERALEEGKQLATLGPLIHNPQMVERFARRGVVEVESERETPPGYVLVLRAHGVAREVYDYLEAEAVPYIDATCPFVANIHRIVAEHSADGAQVVVVGDPDHPEVRGICGHCAGPARVVAGPEELAALLRDASKYGNKGYILVAQTTLNLTEWRKCVEIAEKECTNLLLFDTICSATTMRQTAAEALSRNCDAMVVVGGRGSSNTQKLAAICSQHCPTRQVETASELDPGWFAGAQRLGITAGASTPSFIIKEVQNAMSEITNVQDDMSFEEMLEQSLKTIYSKEKVTATVNSVSPNEIAVDIAGTKHAGYVPLHEFTDDPNAKLDELVNVGDELELIVLRVNDVEGTVMLSKKRLDAIAGFEKVVEAEEADAVLEGMVVDIVKGGVIALCNGVRVFIPASQATMSRNQPLEPLLKTTVQFKILETNRQRRRAVGSIRAVLKEQRKELEEQFWKEVEIGRKYQGTVKSLTSYGAFVDLGGVDGMVHISELSWSRIKDPSEVVKVGDQLEVYVKDVDFENKKISLGYKKDEDNPWSLLKQQVQPGDVATVKIVSMTPFGAFAQVIPGVDGLIHISQISNVRIGKPSDVLSIGQEVEVKVTDIDYEKKRVSLSIRALLGPEDRSTFLGNPVEDDAPMTYEAAPPEARQPEPAAEEPAEVEAVAEEPVDEEAAPVEEPAPAETPTVPIVEEAAEPEPPKEDAGVEEVPGEE